MRFVEHYTAETPESLYLGDKLQREADAARAALTTTPRGSAEPSRSQQRTASMPSVSSVSDVVDVDGQRAPRRRSRTTAGPLARTGATAGCDARSRRRARAYSFHATQTVGQSRKQPGRPAIDILVDLINGFADELDGDDVPPRLNDAWDRMIDRYVAATARDTTRADA